jgi:DtxR family Mn-dependent transcriptional regulator
MVSTKNQSVEEKPLTSVMEDYLEAIFDLDKEKRVVRVKDIAKRMSVKMPTVSSMLKTLRSRGLVNYEKYEYVELTKDGADVGKEMRRRHQMLYRFLTEILKIDAKIADDEACKMEHTLSESTLESLTAFMTFIQTCPRAGLSWLDRFEEYRATGGKPKQCVDYCDTFSEEFKCQVEAIKNQPSRPTKKK